MSNVDKVDLIFPTEIADWLYKIENNVYGHIDNKMLSNMLKVAFFWALKKSEVLNLKIGDVNDQNNQVKNDIKIRQHPIPISEDDEQFIINHIKYLSSDPNYKNQRDAFLFQNKKGEQYSEATRQLRNSFKIDRPFQKLREASIKNKALTSGKQIDEVANSAGIDPRQLKAIITQKKIPAGKKTDIQEKLQALWNHTNGINQINERFKDDLKELEKRSKDFIKSVNESKKIPDALKEVLLKEVDKIFKQNKIVFKAIDSSISLSSHKDMSLTNTIKKLTTKDNKDETYETLLWLIDHAIIFPITDIDEVDRYKDFFLKTLSVLSYSEDSQKNQNLKKILMNSFADNFVKRNVVFNHEIGSPYIWDKKKEDKEKKILLTGLIKDSHKRDVSGEVGQSLISILRGSKNEDLKQLVKYILKNSKNETSSLKIQSYYFNDHSYDLKLIAEYIQKFHRDEKDFGIKKVAPYKEVACFVADNLTVDYDRSEETDIIEFKILKKILEYSLESMDNEEKTKLLNCIFSKGITDEEKFYNISLIIANALTMLELNERLNIHRESEFVDWVKEFEGVIGENFKKISEDFLTKDAGFFESLGYVVHMAMLRQLQKRRSILFRDFKQFRVLFPRRKKNIRITARKSFR